VRSTALFRNETSFRASTMKATKFVIQPLATIATHGPT
jgi:hypothetical protein